MQNFRKHAELKQDATEPRSSVENTNKTTHHYLPSTGVLPVFQPPLGVLIKDIQMRHSRNHSELKQEAAELRSSVEDIITSIGNARISHGLPAFKPDWELVIDGPNSDPYAELEQDCRMLRDRIGDILLAENHKDEGKIPINEKRVNDLESALKIAKMNVQQMVDRSRAELKAPFAAEVPTNEHISRKAAYKVRPPVMLSRSTVSKKQDENVDSTVVAHPPHRKPV